ncbi:hypothetical protein [Lichenicoccus sp.]|uniref:hypothetical protein n=1 Tax=Lichenicoccus sp. TaxID=2781899 RepID=UPI003D0B085E
MLPPASLAAASPGSGRAPPTSEDVVRAKQALAQAQARVDADRRAHSPDCVAYDQKGVDKAASELAGARSSAASNGGLSLVV